jgi:hypothetical protein
MKISELLPNFSFTKETITTNWKGRKVEILSGAAITCAGIGFGIATSPFAAVTIGVSALGLSLLGHGLFTVDKKSTPIAPEQETQLNSIEQRLNDLSVDQANQNGEQLLDLIKELEKFVKTVLKSIPEKIDSKLEQLIKTIETKFQKSAGLAATLRSLRSAISQKKNSTLKHTSPSASVNQTVKN